MDTDFLPVDMHTRVSRNGAEVVVTVLGEIDMASGPLLWERIADSIPEVTDRLVLDLAGTTFMDSTGMAVFLRAHKELQLRGAELLLRGPGALALQVLRITGLDTVLTIEDPQIK